MWIKWQEFPYDIGVWKNLCQAMGTSNPVMWFMPFGGAPGIESAGTWEVNGFEDKDKVWPPPDPDKMPRGERPTEDTGTWKYGTVEEEKAAFKRRQQEDHKRWAREENLEEVTNEDDESEEYESEYEEEGIDGEKGWTNSDGDRLRDYGVDEEAEVVGDDEIPLGELLRRRNARASGQAVNQLV